MQIPYTTKVSSSSKITVSSNITLSLTLQYLSIALTISLKSLHSTSALSELQKYPLLKFSLTFLIVFGIGT